MTAAPATYFNAASEETIFSALQRDANRILGFTAQQTLDCLQSLYGIIAVDRAKNIASDRAGGVAVVIVVHSRDDTDREIMLVAQRTINCEMLGGWLLCAYVHPTCIPCSKAAEKRSPPPREDCAYLLDPGVVHDGPPRRTHSIGDSIQRNRTSKEKRGRCDPQW